MPEFAGPFSGVVPRKLTRTELARAIMFDISAELEAIHIYQSHIDATDDEVAKAVLAHVRNEEEEHVGEFMTLLEHLDPGLARRVGEGREDIAAVIERAKAGIPAEVAAKEEEVAAAAQAAAQPLTVGDLKG